MRFDWKPESKERYFQKVEAAVKAAGFDDILQIAYILRYKLQRFTWMFKVKDCRHICLFCEYYDTCRQEGKGK